MSLRRTPFRRVLYRPRLWLGGERELTMCVALVAAGLAMIGQNLVSIGVAAALWFGSIGLFRQMAKADPQMVRVYMRQVRQRGYYPPRSRPSLGGSGMGAAAQWAILCAAVLAFFSFIYWIA